MYITTTIPYVNARPHLGFALELVQADEDADLDRVLDTLVRACRTLADQLRPFLPDTADRVAARVTPVAGRLPDPRPLFPKIVP